MMLGLCFRLAAEDKAAASPSQLEVVYGHH
jgi:hypothetical protein